VITVNIIKSILIGLGVVAVAGFLACDENSPPPVDPGNPVDTVAYYIDEGTPTNPLDITGLIPYDGQVSKNGHSFYRITGVIPNEIYTITLKLSDGLPYQIVPNATSVGNYGCGWTNETPDTAIDCAMRASAAGVMDFYVRGDTTVGGAFEVSFTQGGVVNEGSIDAPVEVNSFPFTAGAQIASYYRLTGLTPGAAYACEFTDASGPVEFFLFSDETYGTGTCSVQDWEGESCNIIADASGCVYLKTQVRQQQHSITYTISVTIASVANEGSRDAPIDITGLLPYPGMVHLCRSWYILSGLTPGSPYTISLSNATDTADLVLYGPGWDAGESDCFHWWRDGDGVSIECVSVADANGDIRIAVRGFDSVDGATYDLDMTSGGIPNEGYSGAPIDITGVTPWSGSVYNGTSYYKITGMAASTEYTVTLTNLTADLWMWVDDDGSAVGYLCFTNQPGTADESCIVQTTTGEFHIRIEPAYGAIQGATYLLNVTQ
jgi:hypothetical protein